MCVLDQSVPVYKYFEQISKIPHGSFNEKQLSDYVVSFAKEHNLKYLQDDMGNVVIYKNASVGYESHDVVMLQGHMDMVCEKNKDTDFDFEKDSMLNFYKMMLDGYKNRLREFVEFSGSKGKAWKDNNEKKQIVYTEEEFKQSM